MQILTTLQLISAEMVRSLCWTLIHSLWQGLIAAFIAGVIMTYTRHASSTLRYNLLSALFVLFLIGAGFTFYLEYNLYGAEHLPNGKAIPAFAPTEYNYQVNTIITGERSSYITDFINFLNKNAPYAVLLWFIFFLGKCINVVRGIYAAHRIRTSYIHRPSDTWINRLQELKQKLGITKRVLLYESQLVKIPVTVGHLKAAILVPIGLLANLPADQVESILLHELAHIRRKDYLVNFLQTLAEAVLFFNPAVLWISSLIREERESCCDDMVVAHMPDKRNYLEALVSFHQYSTGNSYAIGFTGKRNYLLDRVRRLVFNENKKLNIIERSVLVLSIILVTTCGFIMKNGTQKEVDKVSRSGTGILQDMTVPQSQSYVSGKEADTFPRKKGITTGQLNTKREFKSVLFDRTNDPGDPVHTYDITDNNSNTFRITRNNNQMIALSVNDQAIPGNQLSNFQNIFNKAETFILERYKKKNSMLTSKLDAKKNSKAVLTSLSKKEKPEPNTILLSKDGKTKPDANKLITHKGPASSKAKKGPEVNPGWENDAQRIKGVLQELVEAGVIANAASADWFAIDESKMMVNDNEIGQELHNKLKTKYGIKPNYGLFYGQTKMFGTGIYYDKKDLQAFSGKE